MTLCASRPVFTYRPRHRGLACERVRPDDPGPTMFHCTILFALKPGISLDKVRSAREALQALIETMPGVDHLTVTHNVATESQGYNLALFSGFESKEACEIFLRHPEYRRVLDEELAPLVENRVVAMGSDEA